MIIINNNIIITSELNNFLIGSKLGDGCFIQRTPNHNTYINFSQCEDQLSYLKWKYEFLKKYNCIKDNVEIKMINPNTRKCFSTKQKQYTFHTKSYCEFNYYRHELLYNLIFNIEELGLGIYILDDGSFYNGCCKIGCSSKIFSEKDINCFVDVLYNKFNIKCNVYHHKTNSTKDYFRINKSEFYTVKDIILNNINCEYARRKING